VDSLTVKTVEYGVLKTNTLYVYSSEVRVWYVVPRKQIVRPLFFEETIRAEDYANL